MTATPKLCTRTGCAKKLRASNTKDVCATGCHSPEAPPSVRAKGTRPERSTAIDAAPAAVETGAIERFRMVAEALGKDADAILAEFAQAWLSELAAKVEG